MENFKILIFILFIIFILISIYKLFIYYNRNTNPPVIGGNDLNNLSNELILINKITNLNLKENDFKSIKYFKNIKDHDSINNLINFIKSKYKFYKQVPRISRGDIYTANLYLSLLKKNDINIDKDFKYLDVGCGTGSRTLAIGQTFGISPENVHGADIVDWVSEFSRIPGLNFSEIKIIDGKSVLPFPDDYFNILSINMVLHHVKEEQREEFIREITRVMKKNSILLVKEHNVSIADVSMVDLIDLEHILYACIIHGDNYNNFIKNYYSRYFDCEELQSKLSNICNGGFVFVDSKNISELNKSYIAIFTRN